jgi:mannose-6-phosphate isomerase-like protein (cupin superfamily)
MSPQNAISEDALEAHGESGAWAKVWPDERYVVRIGPAISGQRYVTLELVGITDAGPPLHIHHNEGEHFIILEGIVGFQRGGETFEARAGQTVTVSKGVVHTWVVRSREPARMLITFAPSGFEEAFRALVGAPASEAEAILKRYGFTVEGDKLPRTGSF